MLRPLLLVVPLLGIPLAAQAPTPRPARVPNPPMVQPDVKWPWQQVDKSGAGDLDLSRHPTGPAAPPSAPKSATPADPTPAAAGGLGAAIAQALADPDLVLCDQPTADGPIWCRGNNYKASFASGGWSFIARPAELAQPTAPITFRLHSVTAAGAPLRFEDVAPTQRDHRIEYARGTFCEAIDLRGRSVEQTFRFDSLPNRGELVLCLQVRTDRIGEDLGDGMVFRSASGDVTYGEAVVIDATGDRVRAETVLANGTITITVPADFVARAALPLLVDPTVAASLTVPNGGISASLPDVVWIAASGYWMVVSQDLYNATDADIFLIRLNDDLVPIGNLIAIDNTTTSWEQPKVAYLPLYDKFLVAARVSQLGQSPHWIGGRIVAAQNLLKTPQFDIERAGVPGHFAGDKSHHDAAGDPSLDGPTFFTVVWERESNPGDHDIHCKQVTETGTLRAPAPTILDNSPAFESNPSISQSDSLPEGSQYFRHQRFMVAYQRTFATGDEDIYGAMLTWDGQVVRVNNQGNFAVQTSPANDTLPQASTPSDASDPLSRYSLFVYQRTIGLDTDILATVCSIGGVVRRTRSVTLLENDPVRAAWPQSRPVVECDGRRYAVAYQELYQGAGADYDTRLSLLYYDESSDDLLLLENSVPLGVSGHPETDPQIASCYSSSGERSPRYALVHTHVGSPRATIDAFTYDGYAPGGFTTRSTSCGPLVLSTTGAPAIGYQCRFTLNDTSPLTGFLFGLGQPAVAIPQCPNCLIGVNGSALLQNPLPWTIPADIGFLGVTLAVQGFTFGGGPCLGQVSFSDTIDVVVQ